MALIKLVLRPGVNRENTRYTSESGWYVCDKVRFRQGTPESIGGWVRISASTFQGVCRALWNWITLDGSNLMAVGTNLKYYIENGGAYYDITPIRSTTTGTATFAATNGSSTLTVTDAAHGCLVGDFVTYTLAVSLGGVITATVLNKEYQIVSVPTVNTYTINVTTVANASDTGNGGALTVAKYQLNVGPEFQIPLIGWSAGFWGEGYWGIGGSTAIALRLWSQNNFGEDLIFGTRGGAIYYWDKTTGLTVRGVPVTGLVGASDVPIVQNFILVSDISRFVFAFGCNEIGSATQDPLLVRWSDQESAVDWTPAPTNQAGSLRLSHGSAIQTALQTRQEVLVFTDTAVYSMQYVGAPIVWGATMLGDNISCIGPNSVSLASGVAYWMGVDKFYKYDGTVQTLKCDLWQYVFSDINLLQSYQVFSSTNEGFNEIWWFYCSSGSTTVDKYVVYNYLEEIWYYGEMARTAWIDAGTRNNPVAATYSYNLVNHESGVDNGETATLTAINSYIESAEWDPEDGHKFSFIYRMLPDITFRSSTGGSNPQVTMTIIPMKNSGSGYNNPQSVGGSSNATVVRTAIVPIEEFTGQVFIRVRGRQFIFKVEANQLGTGWQLGRPRVDIRPDGLR
jgi:hypothetical protein